MQCVGDESQDVADHAVPSLDELVSLHVRQAESSQTRFHLGELFFPMLGVLVASSPITDFTDVVGFNRNYTLEEVFLFAERTVVDVIQLGQPRERGPLRQSIKLLRHQDAGRSPSD